MKLDTSLHGIFSLVSITLFVFHIIAKCIHIVNDVNTSANGTLTSHYRKVMFYHNLFFLLTFYTVLNSLMNMDVCNNINSFIIFNTNLQYILVILILASIIVHNS